MANKLDQIFKLKIEGLEDVEKFKEIIEELKKTFQYKDPNKKLTFEQVAPYYKELKRLYEEMANNVYPEMKVVKDHLDKDIEERKREAKLQENLDKVVTDRRAGDKIAKYTFHEDAIREGGNAILEKIALSEQASFQLEDYSNRKIDIKSSEEKLKEQMENLILSEFVERIIGTSDNKGRAEELKDLFTGTQDMYDILNIDYNAPDADQQLFDMIADKALVNLDKRIKYSQEAINLLKNVIGTFKEKATFESAFDSQMFVSFNEYALNNEAVYEDAKRSLEEYGDMEEATKERILELMREQMAVKTEFYIKDAELKKKYNIGQDFSWWQQFGRGRYFENSAQQAYYYNDDRDALKEVYDRRLERIQIFLDQFVQTMGGVEIFTGKTPVLTKTQIRELENQGVNYTNSDGFRVNPFNNPDLQDAVGNPRQDSSAIDIIRKGVSEGTKDYWKNREDIGVKPTGSLNFMGTGADTTQPTVRQAMQLVGGGGVSYFVAPGSVPSAGISKEVVEETNENVEYLKTAYQKDLDNQIIANASKGNLLVRFLTMMRNQPDELKTIFGTIDSLLGIDTRKFVEAFATKISVLPGFVSAVKDANEEVNENMQQSADERKKVAEEEIKSATSNISLLTSSLSAIFGKDLSKMAAPIEKIISLIPGLSKVFGVTNKKINDEVKDSAEEREGIVGQSNAKIVSGVEKMANEIASYAQLASELMQSIFAQANEDLDERIELADERIEEIKSKQDELVDKIQDSDSRIKELQEEAKSAQGGRLAIIEEQIDREIAARRELANEENQLAKDKEKAEKEKEKLERQQKKNALKQQFIEGIASTALGVAKALGSSPPPINFIMAALVGAAGAVQTAIIAKQLSKLADGGLLRGRSHTQGGMRIEGTNIEVEGGEYVVNRLSTQRNLGLVRYINSQRRQLTPQDIDGYFASSGAQAGNPSFRTMFAAGGQLPSEDALDTYGDSAVLRAIGSINLQPVVSVVDILDVQQSITQVTQWGNAG